MILSYHIDEVKVSSICLTYKSSTPNALCGKGLSDAATLAAKHAHFTPLPIAHRTPQQLPWAGHPHNILRK